MEIFILFFFSIVTFMSAGFAMAWAAREALGEVLMFMSMAGFMFVTTILHLIKNFEVIQKGLT